MLFIDLYDKDKTIIKLSNVKSITPWHEDEISYYYYKITVYYNNKNSIVLSYNDKNIWQCDIERIKEKMGL